MSKVFVTTKDKRTNYKEGDIWTENGKEWTIKNGLKRTVSKKDTARKDFFVPLACPVCNSAMKHHLDVKMWTLHNSCFQCVIDLEHKIIKAGNWKQYEKDKITANIDAFCKDMEASLNEFIQESVTKTNVTEDGMVEKWKDADQGFLKSVVDKEVEELKTKIEKYKNE
jgi:hypothetical protein